MRELSNYNAFWTISQTMLIYQSMLLFLPLCPPLSLCRTRKTLPYAPRAKRETNSKSSMDGFRRTCVSRAIKHVFTRYTLHGREKNMKLTNVTVKEPLDLRLDLGLRGSGGGRVGWALSSLGNLGFWRSRGGTLWRDKLILLERVRLMELSCFGWGWTGTGVEDSIAMGRWGECCMSQGLSEVRGVPNNEDDDDAGIWRCERMTNEILIGPYSAVKKI